MNRSLPSEATERAWMERMRAGDEAAFELLFHRYYRPLFLFAERFVHSAEVAEDLTVDVFVRLWERRGEREVHGSVRGYLYTAVRNAALSHLKRERMVQRAHESVLRDDVLPGHARPSLGADARVQAREVAQAVDEAIERLPDRTREAFVLHRKHGLTYAEVAEVMEISPRTVEVHIRTAVKSLRASLSAFVAAQ
ncbi:MAG TPA: RNA polymerase sigma-70 factor [Longimicrobiaceae bacterium]|nr:RNA polymerase sigma-70 factor [Longimicrobiaceae bacterium]